MPKRQVREICCRYGKTLYGAVQAPIMLVMASVLKAQIEVLAKQLQPHGTTPNDVEEAVAVLLFLYEQILSREHRLADRQPPAPTADRQLVIALYRNWLEGADQILPLLRELKSHGQQFSKTPSLVKACVRARGLIAATLPRNEAGQNLPLEEVQRELQGRA